MALAHVASLTADRIRTATPAETVEKPLRFLALYSIEMLGGHRRTSGRTDFRGMADTWRAKRRHDSFAVGPSCDSRDVEIMRHM